jgi:hypothetical protein
MNWAAILGQCVMCYRNAAAQGAARGRVLDAGIVVLIVPPLLIIAGILWRAVRSDSLSASIKADSQHKRADAGPARADG